VERAEHQVPGLGGRDGERGGLEVPELPDEEDVRVLAQRAAERGRELSVCSPTSRWLMRQRLRSWTNSIGSSMVMMCLAKVWFA
jgi:hypothetical protein